MYVDLVVVVSGKIIYNCTIYNYNTGLCIGGRSRLPHGQIPKLVDTQGFKFYAFLIDGLY
jgi:hypothetical protein